MDCETPVILAIVAVGAMAMQLELRIPGLATFAFSGCPVHGLALY